MKCQGLYLGSPCKDSWFEVDRRVIKIMNTLGVAILWHLARTSEGALTLIQLGHWSVGYITLGLHCILFGHNPACVGNSQK
jgi:hypothetical protein